VPLVCDIWAAILVAALARMPTPYVCPIRDGDGDLVPLELDQWRMRSTQSRAA